MNNCNTRNKLARIFLIIFLSIGILRDKPKAECVGCGGLLVILPVAFIGVDFLTTGVVHGTGVISGNKGSYWRSYFAGLGVGFLSAMIAANYANKGEIVILSTLGGMISGNLLGEFVPSQSERTRIYQKQYKVEIIKINF